MINQRFISIISILLLLITSSCITIINKVEINPDKSGTAFIGVEINVLAKFKSLNSDISKDEKNTIIKFPEVIKEKLKDIKGISNIKTFGVVNFGRFGVEFDFKNAKALNKAYYRLLDKEYKWYYPSIIKIKARGIKVKNVSPYIKSYIEENKDSFSEDIIKFVDVATVINVPKPIKSVDNDEGSISYNKSIFTYIIPLENIMKDNASMGFRIKY